MLSIEEYIARRKKDNLNEFDIDERIQNRQKFSFKSLRPCIFETF